MDAVAILEVVLEGDAAAAHPEEMQPQPAPVGRHLGQPPVEVLGLAVVADGRPFSPLPALRFDPQGILERARVRGGNELPLHRPDPTQALKPVPEVGTVLRAQAARVARPSAHQRDKGALMRGPSADGASVGPGERGKLGQDAALPGQIAELEEVPVVLLRQVRPNRPVGLLRAPPHDDVAHAGVDVREELEPPQPDAVEGGRAQHQGRQPDEVAAVLHQQDAQLPVASEAFPPSADPLVAKEGIGKARLAEEKVPRRLQGEERSHVGDGLHAESRCGRGGRGSDRARGQTFEHVSRPAPVAAPFPPQARLSSRTAAPSRGPRPSGARPSFLTRSWRAMISRWISLVPSPIVHSFTSR